MSTKTLANQKTKKYQPKPWVVKLSDLRYWVSIGCVTPSVNKLKKVIEAEIAFKKTHGVAIIQWHPNGKFTITNRLQ